MIARLDAAGAGAVPSCMAKPFAPVPEPNAGEHAPDAHEDPVARRQTVRLARKTQSLDTLYQVAISLSQPGSLEQVLGGFLDILIELVGARAASVRIATGDGHTRLVASRGLDADVAARDHLMPIGTCPCSLAASEGGLRVQDGSAPCAALIGRAMIDPECIEMVAVPVQYRDRILGVYNLFLDQRLAAMGEDMPDLLASVGLHLGLALEKTRLEGEASRLAILEERNIIGAELHDSLAQSLVGMRMQVVMLSESLGRDNLGAVRYEAKSLHRAMTQAQSDLRDLLTNFRLKIEGSGLAQTVSNLVERFSRESGIAVFFQNECEIMALSPAQETQVFFIIQEALTNIRRHSEAKNVRIRLDSEGDLYALLIEDDGLGMSGVPEGPQGRHAGLEIMRQRAGRVPGQLVIESEPGEGTRIVLIFNAPSPASGS